MAVTIRCFILMTTLSLLQGCIYKIVTVPVKVAYTTTKVVVKGTAAVVEAVIPDGDAKKAESEAQSQSTPAETKKD